MATTSTGTTTQLDQETRNQEIVASLRSFLKHQTERVSLYKEFNDAFKEYTAKRMTPEEYATICNIVTQGFVELSIEILALEAHLGGPSHAAAMNTTTAATTPNPSASTETTSPEISQRVSLNSPEHAQLIREVQLLEKQKLALTVQGQKWFLEKEAQETQDQQDREAENQADRIVGEESERQATEAQQQQEGSGQGHANGGIKLSAEEWQAKVDDNRDKLNETVEAINEKLADIQEAIAVLVL
ncbi:hypothetical protein B0O80DRAFT_497686 [Mortierella sp. GBAus27b]|nr:hypothetical protein BGX31_001575 [Mortierella sp. GBA43]KAI8355289.1 hypothetical protein B0O80DRAFT_497686 [Mortierella sp. GBAus27b]